MNKIFKNVNWKKEYEGYISIYPEKTGLKIKLMLDDCNSAMHYHHPVVVFLQNSYDTELFDEKVPISADENAENIFDLPIKIYHKDYIKARLWIMKHWKLIHRLSKMEIDIFGFSDELKKYESDGIDDSLNESVDMNAIFEMAIIKGNITGLDYNIWVDNEHTWEASGHAPRLKVQNTSRSSDPHNWNPFIFSEMKFDSKCAQDVKKYPAKFKKNIIDFINANKQVLLNATCGDVRMTDDDIKQELLSIKDIKKGLTKETIDKDVVVWYRHSKISNTNDYIVIASIINDVENFNVAKMNTLIPLSDKNYSAIIPSLRYDENGKFVYGMKDFDTGKLEKIYL